jgi:hypothetical protein
VKIDKWRVIRCASTREAVPRSPVQSLDVHDEKQRTKKHEATSRRTRRLPRVSRSRMSAPRCTGRDMRTARSPQAPTLSIRLSRDDAGHLTLLPVWRRVWHPPAGYSGLNARPNPDVRA